MDAGEVVVADVCSVAEYYVVYCVASDSGESG